jgi:transposase
VQIFGTTAAELLRLREWLEEHSVTHVALESRGVYWKPIYDAVRCLLVNAAHIKQVPGRKTDVQDCVWIAQLLEHGLLRGSFVPPAPIRELRDLTRYRKGLIQEWQWEANRLHKVLQDAGIKLASVATNILGVSGRAMLEALVAGTTAPEVLAELARGKLRAKLPALREALAGRVRPHHAFLVNQGLAHLDYLDEAIDTVSAEVKRLLVPFADALRRLDTIPGINARTGQMVIAEIGVDMSRVPREHHLASGAGSARATTRAPASSRPERRGGATAGSAWR